MAPPVRRWLLRNGLLVKSEFALPWGVCDFVAVALNPSRVQTRLDFGQTRAIGSATRLQILSKIPERESGRAISFSKLEKQFDNHVPPEELVAALEFFLRNRFVVTQKSGNYQRVNGWAPLHDRIIAVENKLERLSEAIRQAVANLSFATESYVALPGEFAARIANGARSQMFTSNRIGLIGVWNRLCRELIPPVKAVFLHNEIIQAHVVERFWRTKGN